MADISKNILIAFDDREFVKGDVRSLVGSRRFGDVIYKRKALSKHFYEVLPEWAKSSMFHLRTDDDLHRMRKRLESCGVDVSVCIIAAKAGFPDLDCLTQLLERLPYAEEDFSDSLYHPLIVFLRNAHTLIVRWNEFLDAPLHRWEYGWQECQRLKSFVPRDLEKIQDFLLFFSGSTATRHFNQVQIDSYYYTKRSSDKNKMRAEYSYYDLVPENMRPWLVQPFGFQDEGETASYKMLRYYLADAALQWVHGAFDVASFSAFIERVLFFIAERAQRACTKDQSRKMAEDLFVTKLKVRVQKFLELDEGRRINQLVSSANPELDVNQQLHRYMALYQKYAEKFIFDYCSVGHGDPCFSNLLYDQQRYLLKLIDPKGAVIEEELWTHPIYDLCKLSHSVLGDYDFINNGLYNVGFSDANDLVLNVQHDNHALLKPIFLKKITEMGFDADVVRLGEASLFLSMLPLHIDYPNKVIAFLLTAKNILDEVEA
jgi:hypothetical protein